MKERFDLTKANITISGKFMNERTHCSALDNESGDGYCQHPTMFNKFYCGFHYHEYLENNARDHEMREDLLSKEVKELEKKLAEALDKKLQWSDACYQAQDKLKVAVGALGKIGDSDVVWIDSAKRIASETLLKIKQVEAVNG